MTDRGIRSTWRPVARVVRIDDRAVNWMAFSPVVVIAGWIVLCSFGILSGGGSSPDAFFAPAFGLWAFDTIAALVDRARVRATREVFPASVLWCFATPFVYLPLRRRALLEAGRPESWLPFAIHACCFGAVALGCGGVLALEALARGAVA